MSHVLIDIKFGICLEALGLAYPRFKDGLAKV